VKVGILGKILGHFSPTVPPRLVTRVETPGGES